MTRKNLRNIIWAGAAMLAVASIIYNPCHLATAGIMFILGSFQDDPEEDR